MRQLRLMACVGLAAVLGACGGGGGGGGLSTNPGGGIQNPGGGTQTSPNTVTLANLSFSPASMTVPVGTTVIWKWNDCSGGDGYGGGTTCIAHNVTFDDSSIQASTTQDAGTISRTFSTKGTYKYHCTIHGAAGMVGEIVVQ